MSELATRPPVASAHLPVTMERPPSPPVVTVQVTVRTIAGQVPCAGRTWGPAPTTIDADAATVRDLLANTHGLQITWPDGFVAPSGVKPADGRLDAATKAHMSSGDRVAAAEAEARSATARAQTAESQARVAQSQYGAEVSQLRRLLEEKTTEVTRLAVAITHAKAEGGGATATLDDERKQHASTVARMIAQHQADLDNLRAQHAQEAEVWQQDKDRLTAEIERLTETATTPAGKAKAAGRATGATAQV